jgi:hypothetical protein
LWEAARRNSHFPPQREKKERIKGEDKQGTHRCQSIGQCWFQWGNLSQVHAPYVM